METDTRHTLPATLEVTESGEFNIEIMEPDGASFLEVIDAPEGMSQVDFGLVVTHRYNNHAALVEALRLASQHLTMFTENGAWDDEDEKALVKIDALLSQIGEN